MIDPQAAHLKSPNKCPFAPQCRPAARKNKKGPNEIGPLLVWFFLLVVARAGLRPAPTASRLQCAANRFYFGVVLQDFVAHFATPAGLLVAAERERGVEDVVAIDPDCAGLQL